MAGLIELDVREFGGREWVSLVAYEELKNRLVELDRDITQLRKNGHITDTEKEENRRVMQSFLDQKTELDNIAQFIRLHYQKEINLGQHAAFRTLADCVAFYLGKERLYAKPWWKRLWMRIKGE